MKWPRTKGLTIALCLLICSALQAQITVQRDAETGKTVATVATTVPEGATFDGGWKLSRVDTKPCKASKEALAEPNTIGIWAKEPGTYQVEYSGFWLLLKTVTFKDGDGNEVQIQSYLGHGFIDESATFEVEGENGPDPPPDGKGPYRVFFIEEGDRTGLPQGQRLLLSSLEYRERMEALGHDYGETLFPHIVSQPPERLRTIALAASGKEMPVVVVQSLKNPGYIRSFPLPDNYEALAKELDQ